jgi:hypothetical protein
MSKLLVDNVCDGTPAVKLANAALDESNVEAVVEELSRRAGQFPRQHLHLDLSDVTRINSPALAKLLKLHRRLLGAGGQLTLHNVGGPAGLGPAWRWRRSSGLRGFNPVPEEVGPSFLAWQVH